jgi:hypothetical protein
MAQSGFFDLDNRYESISKLGDPLEVLDWAIPVGNVSSRIEQSLAQIQKKAMRVLGLTIAFSCLKSLYCKASTI